MRPPQTDDRGLRDRDARLHAFLAQSPVMAFIKDHEGRYVFANASMERTFGFQLDEIQERADVEWLSASPRLDNRDRDALESNRSVETLETVPTADGTVRHFLVIRFPIAEEGRKLVGGIAVDVTTLKQEELRQAHEQLQTLSLTDELTGLQNRRGFFMLATRLLQTAPRSGQEFTVLYTDVDNLKTVNDTYGHDVGSAVLVGAAEVLKNTFRAADVVARIGGDEFVALAPISRSGSSVITDRLQTHLATFNARSGLPCQLSLSFGMAHFDPAGTTTLEEVVRQADHAMYEHKRSKHRK